MRRAIWLLLLAAGTGCVFRDAPGPRYFRPESAALDGAAGDGAAPQAGVPVRLRSVQATPFLRERMVWRASAVEYGVYEQRRWSELPASYVQRALAASLGRTNGLRLTEDAQAASVRVDLVAFDEVLAPAREAAVGLVVSLRDARHRRLLDRSFGARSPIAEDTPAATASAMGQALDAVVAEVAAAVAAAMRAP